MPINVLRISKYAIGSLMSLSIYTCYNNGCNIWASNHVTKIGFKERKIVEYENRIRQFSGPDKIFRYFATVSVESNNQQSKTLMTTDDFISLVYKGLKTQNYIK
ncbi:hypothetical protein A3Q56_05647 [Intoshia linei]|uniref:Uncharacterized protein n=1 Tax=Intoshia linei TaxID=1819745 RepID=A0A177AXL0_9BILA|nr:hypothetical protein A3Q56_05647 [Intoshia linei]